ncbi:MAG: GcrA cell cycle regulator [Patescibacteria group bacterium]|nr:GcrA cell cycle regulator [Patescibacteria group bacterium]
MRLRDLCDEGLSTAEIGRRLGISKNAIVGKAHRLDLTARPSPIRRGSAAQHREQKPRRIRPGSETLPALPSSTAQASTALAVSVPSSQKMAGTGLKAAEVVVRLPAALPTSSPAAPAVALPVRVESVAPTATPKRAVRAVTTCLWPIGEPGKRGFRFCDDASAPGKPYCDEHVKLAYVKIGDRREDAA